MRHESIRGRRGALVGASAAVLCLGGALAACGGGGSGGGYVAVGAAGGSPRPSGAVAAPSGEVSLVPLRGAKDTDGSNDPGDKGSSGPGATASTTDPGSPSGDGTGDPDGAATRGGGSGGTGSAEGGTGAGAGGPGGVGTGGGGGSASSSGGDSGRTGGSSGQSSAPPAPGSTVGTGPAVLSVSDTSRAAADRRWCEKVTVSFRNTGGTAVRSGTVTFGTHIIGSLGIDWATIGSTEALPAPIAAGAKKSRTWTVCVDAWRVPLGMHIETRDVSVQWK
ncbi:hypothetical protein [Streptomyces sp. NPDC002685]|uniref:hypothetical protein n=1 Tax=Streptomyces sp. NPDC002685 TaxID=3154540 RepID=UPI00332E974B